MRNLCSLIIVILFFNTVTVQAFIPLSAPSAILIDSASGRVLYAHNEHARKYPAGLTKMLTALVALDYLNPEDVIVVGSEVNNVSGILSGHRVGEHITVHNLLRGLMIQNGNDSGAILALHTVQAERNRSNIPFSNAMEEFSIMMNRRARELGALNSNFMNPNGLHHDNHYTTAYDLSLIAQAFMQHPLLAEIAAEPEFYGNSLGGVYVEGSPHTIYHHWVDTNELISGGVFHYPYAIGIRSGTTTPASDCLAAAAYRRGVSLIAIVLASPDPGRWQDARILFDYGFATYNYHTVVETVQLIDTILVSNAMLGESNLLDVVSADDFTMLLSQNQLSRLAREIIIEEHFIAENDEDGIILLAPIEAESVLGKIIYTLDGQVVFEGEIKAYNTVWERSLDSDMDYYIAFIRDNIFSIRALPFWLGGIGILIGIAGIYLAVAERRRSRRSRYGMR